MVQLTKIYTRSGDEGMTSLTGGERRAKYDLRVETYGTVDETNAALGLVRLHTKDKEDAMLARMQQDLFDVGADLSTPHQAKFSDALRITSVQVLRLEHEIDAMNEKLAPLNSFVLPGGSKASANLHLARTICRRAERLLCELSAVETVNQVALQYMNRLSDHLFVLARYLNEFGNNDVLWKPGINSGMAKKPKKSPG